MLLHGGRSTQCPPQVDQFDWWAECVDNELVGSMVRGVVGPMGLDLPPIVQDGQEMMHEPMGLEPPPPEQDGLKMLHEGSLTRSPRPAPLEDHDADWWANMIASKLNYTSPVSRSPGGSLDLANSSVTMNNSIAISATPPGSPALSTPVGGCACEQAVYPAADACHPCSAKDAQDKDVGVRHSTQPQASCETKGGGLHQAGAVHPHEEAWDGGQFAGGGL